MTFTSVLCRHLLPLLEMTEEDLVQRLGKEEDFISTCMELLDEDALSEVLGLLADLSEVEDLLLALLLVFEILWQHEKSRKYGASDCVHTISNEVSFLWLVAKRARPANFSRFLASSTAPNLSTEP